MDSPTSLHCFLAIPELVEHTLSFLPMPDLLRVQQVSRNFKALITASVKLQRQLFFQPEPDPVVSDATRHNHLVKNPLLEQCFPVFFRQKDRRRTFDFKFEVPWSDTPAKQEAFVRADASWRRMLVSQPAISTFKVSELMHGQAGDFKRNATIRLPGSKATNSTPGPGLRMGMLYDMTVEYVQQNERSYPLMSVDWRNGASSEPEVCLDLSMTVQCALRESVGEYAHLFCAGHEGKDLLERAFQREDGKGSIREVRVETSFEDDMELHEETLERARELFAQWQSRDG